MFLLFDYFEYSIMLNSFIKNLNNSIDALPLISSLQPSSNPKPQADHNIDVQKLVQAIIRQLSRSLSDKLGQPIDEKEFKDVADDLLRSKGMEANLIETKEKYNELVSKSSSVYQSARKISNCIGEFVTSINLFLQSQELLVPLKEIQKGVNQLQADRVEKQMNYLVKIFENNFQETIDRKIRSAQGSLHEQIKLLKNLNKNLENEILSFKNSKNNEESKYFQSTMKVNTLNQRIAKLSAEKLQLEKALKGQISNLAEKQKGLEEKDKELTKVKSREQELVEKIRSYQLRINRSERSIKEVNNQSDALNTIIDKLKQKQEQLVEEFEAQAKKKESQHQNLRKKLQNEKFVLHQRVEQLCEKITALEASLMARQQEIQKLQRELKVIKEQGFFEIDINTQQQQKVEGDNTQNGTVVDSEKKQKISLKELINRVNVSQGRIQELQGRLLKEMDTNVNKQVLKSLFLNYDDESKEWAVRRNIKYQIYSLLGLNEKVPKLQQTKSSSKWFGIF